MYSGQWSCYDITVVKDKWINGGEGVALLPLAHRGSNSQEHLSAPALRNQDKEEATREGPNKCVRGTEK